MSVLAALVAACGSKACAPPPVGTGGSAPAAGKSKYDTGDSRYELLYHGGLVPGAAEATHSELLMGATKQGVRDLDDGQERDDLREMLYAHQQYTSSLYDRVNGRLRGTAEADDPNERIDAAVDKTIRGLDLAFDPKSGISVPLRQRTTLYRGALLETDADGVRAMFPVGTTVQDKGFVSTSINETEARKFYGSRQTGATQVLFNIKAHEGTRVVGGVSSEWELILNRSTKFKITSVKDETDEDGDPTGRVLVNMRALKP